MGPCVQQRCRIDHITVTAPTLERGAEFVARALGVRMPPGGEHPRMGTHNLLLRLGADVFLEVIAVNPAAARPPRPRWFGLDELSADSPARLATWVARTEDIRGIPADVLEILGPTETMTRGALQWLITIPPDGSMALGGAAPALIQWEAPVHPASRMEGRGCSLVGFEVSHPEPERVSALLQRLGLASDVRVTALRAGEAPRLRAFIDTPAGLRSIGV
jgi:hypothetical protein